MSRSGTSITLGDFRKLLKEDEFIDYFNKFICLPAFAQLVVYSKKRQRFILHPPLPGNKYSLNYNGLVEWLWRKRLNLFLNSRFSGEYRLCNYLIRHSFIKERGRVLKTEAGREVHKALTWLQKKCLGRVSSIRKFRKFLREKSDAGDKLYQYWLDSERLYYNVKKRSSSSMEVFNAIKEKYFTGNGESAMPQHLLDLAWDTLPSSHRTLGIAKDAKTYDITFTICLQRLCASRLKDYWMPRYLLAQNPLVLNEEEESNLNLAKKYLRGGIVLTAEESSSESSTEQSESKIDTETERSADEHVEVTPTDNEEKQAHADKLKSESDSDKKEKSEIIDDQKVPESERKRGRKGVSFSEHPPPGVSSSSSEGRLDKSVKGGSSGSASSSEDEEEYKRKMEKRKARSRERRANRVTGSLKSGESRKDDDTESSDSGSKADKSEKKSSGGSDSAESWEGVHDSYRKNKKEKKFRFKDRHRKRSIHKRNLKFEELLVKESYRRPSMSSDQVKLFAKGKKNIDRQKILLDDDEEELRQAFDGGGPLPDFKQVPKHSPFGGMEMTGGKSLLKAALKLPGSNSLSPPSLPMQDGSEMERPDLFNRSPSMWDLSLDELSRRMNERQSDASSLGSLKSMTSRMSFGKMGKLRRPSSLNRTPSQDSVGSNITVTSVKKRRIVAKNKPKKNKITTLTFSLSGDAPTPADKSARSVDSSDSKKSKKLDQKSLKQVKDRRTHRRATKLASLTAVMIVPTVSPREYTMEKDIAYRSRPENRRLILALQSDQCASQPFRTFLVTTDNEEMVSYLRFWLDVEKTRQDFQYGNMSFNSFMQSMQSIVTQYLLHTSPCRIEAPESLREEAIMNCLSPEMQEMPWQIRKLQKEVMEDLKYAHEAFCQQETQSFLNAAAFKKDEMRQRPPFLPPIGKLGKDTYDLSTSFDMEENFQIEMNSRMSRSLRLIIEINLPDGRDPCITDRISSDESDDDGCVDPPPEPKCIRKPPVDLKELAARSVKQYPDPTNPLGLQTSVKIQFDRRLQSATLYHPLKKGGQLMKRPVIRPKHFQEVLKDTVHFQFFKRYLKAHRADLALSFWNAVENLRIADKLKSRQVKARGIIKKYFHNPKVPATKLLQCNADIIKEIPYLDVVTTSMLFSAQSIIGRVLEERWFRRYAETFEERTVYPSDLEITDKSYIARTQLSRNRRLKHIWVVFNDFIKRAASFLRAMRKPHMFEMFEKYLEREIENEDVRYRHPNSAGPSEFIANRSESTIVPYMFYRHEDENDGVKQRVVNGQLITFNFLPNDLHFWRDIECYKSMANSCDESGSRSINLELEGNMLKTKANLIVSCYLESDIPPKLRVNVPPEVADITIESLQNGLIDRGLFHEATIYVFPLLLHFWKRFCAEHYRYVPTLSKKHRMIYGLKMTPVIAEEMRNKKKGLEQEKPSDRGDQTQASPKKKKSKSKRLATADLPNYLDMDSSKFTKKRGSPFGFDDMGPRLTFSIRRGVTLIEPIRRRKLTVMKPGDSRLMQESILVTNLLPKPKKPANDIPLPPMRTSRRAGVLDAGLLQSFADQSFTFLVEKDDV
uniref:uncharacterized protein LOC120341884 isoform X2 n=1 Tax=Styela clava TaxID=7725 RepID=UPI0019397C51|nr:uncharacterized protein LOC120341884 isoform X2 [Styela clava]